MGELGSFVRQRRHELGYTLEDVAERTGVSHQAISQIELGNTRELRGSTAVRLAKALEIDTEELLGRLPATA